MTKRILMFIAITSMFAIVHAFAESGCKDGKFVGSYTRVDGPNDVFGNGSVIHQFFYNLTLNADGSAQQSWTGNLDYPLNSGTGSPQDIGSWTCRSDGRLVVTLLSAVYLPATPGPGLPLPDLSLASALRVTMLLTVDDNNTLTRIQARVRTYAASADPTDPAAGTLGPLVTRVVTYKRFVASDTDLNLP
ncbi:MAG TPA: hypothetical protein VLI65_02530 [Pyrinomonadaceae bacterium]|nr:hypothetical protein [Pyrinomonadaceae bacterium]